MRVGAPQFASTIWLRQVEADGLEIKAATIAELGDEAEISCVPIRTGTFPWRCRGMEQRGMAGSLVVK